MPLTQLCRSNDAPEECRGETPCCCCCLDCPGGRSLLADVAATAAENMEWLLPVAVATTRCRSELSELESVQLSHF